LDVESKYHAPLLKSIYGLLMCLPQGDAFRLLNDRLTTVCNLRDNLGMSPLDATGQTAQPVSSVKAMQMEKLLKRFDEVMVLHRKAKETARKLASDNEQFKRHAGTTSRDKNNGVPTIMMSPDPHMIHGPSGKTPGNNEHYPITAAATTHETPSRRLVDSPTSTKASKSFDKRSYKDGRV